LFEEFVTFDESLPTGEDTEFHERLPPALMPVWEPAVQTIHLNPTDCCRSWQTSIAAASGTAAI